MSDKKISLWSRLHRFVAWLVALASGILMFGFGLRNYIGFSERFEFVLAKYETILQVVGNLITKIPFASVSSATLNNYGIILGLVFIAKGIMTPLNNKIAERFEAISVNGRFDFQREAAADMAEGLKSTNRFFGH